MGRKSCRFVQSGGLVGRELDPQDKINAVVDGELLHLIQREGEPAPAGTVVVKRHGIHQRQIARWKGADGSVVVVQGDADLLQIVGALDAPGGLARGLDSGQQQGDQTAMIAITTSSSISVKARRRCMREPLYVCTWTPIRRRSALIANERKSAMNHAMEVTGPVTPWHGEPVP